MNQNGKNTLIRVGLAQLNLPIITVMSGKDFALRKNIMDLLTTILPPNRQPYFVGKKCEYKQVPKFKDKGQSWVEQKNGA